MTQAGCPTWESELAKLTRSPFFTLDSSPEYSDSSLQVYLSYLVPMLLFLLIKKVKGVHLCSAKYLKTAHFKISGQFVFRLNRAQPWEFPGDTKTNIYEKGFSS